MPIITPTDKTLSALDGIHLWHFGLSSCSQRVRITLAEKKLDYISHIIDLTRGENATSEYQSIHPKGLVPAILINGDLVIESIDILSELDCRYLPGSLEGNSLQEKEQIRTLSERANAAQSSLKLITFEFLFRHLPPPSEADSRQFQNLHKNENLKRFHKDFESGFSKKSISDAVQHSHADFNYLDTILSDGRSYLCGETFTLADVAWMPNFHRYDLIKWPFERYSFLRKWFERVSARPSYHEGLSQWEDRALIAMVTPKIMERHIAGDGVEKYLPKPPIKVWEGMSNFTSADH